MISRHHLLALLAECSGDEIWSVEHCRIRRVPEMWIEQLSDALESGFDRDSNTIYTDDGVVNQYYGIKDVDLAIRIADQLGVQVSDTDIRLRGRSGTVRAIKEAIENGDTCL